MNRIFTLLVLLLFTSSVLQAQRYATEIFSEVKVTENVQYATNATVLFFATEGEAVPIPLFMDVYEPEGDNITERPLVLVFHTGNFLPPVTNGQIAGSRKDSSSVEICTQLARRGFVAAAVDYRTGWNPLAETQPERALGLIQAAYRGVQDGRTAIRFFRSTVDSGNPYGVDEERIAVWGNGTGGYLILGMAGLSQYTEILTTTNPAAKFLLDTDGDMVPDAPMVAEPYHGDINGEALTIAPDAAYGLPAGDTTNMPNHIGLSNDFDLAINVGGALGDISWLSDQEVPIISVQSINDIFAPYDDAILIVPTTGDPIVQVQGAQQIGASQEASGINQPWKDLAISDAVTMDAMAGAASAGHPYYEGTYSWERDPNTGGVDEGVIINWWDPNDPAPGEGMGIPWNMLPHPAGGTFHDQGLVLNEGMSADKARGNIADIMAYVIPRACETLDLDCTTINAEEAQLPADLIEVAPNPTVGFVNVTTADQEPIHRIEIFSMDGRQMSSMQNLMETQHTVDMNQYTPGTYVMKIFLENGFVVKKLMVK